MQDINHRIVLVSGGIKLGGAATFLLNLAGELVRRRVTVQVISLEHENPYASDFQLLGIPLHVEDERTTIFEDRLSSALHIIRDFKPTVVISCLGPSSYEILRYIPKWVTRLGMLQSDFPQAYPILAVYAPFFDGTIAVSRQIEANFRAHPVLGRLPTHYLPYGVTMPRNSTPRVRRQDAPIRILYLGRLCRPQKRVQLFPKILGQLRAAGVPFEWTIAGDGPELSWLENEMISSPPDSVVQFPGAISYRDVPHLLESHDVFLLASDEEGLPLSLLEAMAHGLVPVVSNLTSGISEVVDEKCGILVRPDDVEGYAAGIAWLWQNAAAFSAMAEKAPERVRVNYSVAAMTDRWLRLLTQLDKGKKGEWWPSVKVSAPFGSKLAWLHGRVPRMLRRWAKKVTLAASRFSGRESSSRA